MWQVLVDYMYHQIPWEEVEANDEASEVARILEVIQHEEEHISKMDYPKDADGNRVLVVRQRDSQMKGGSALAPTRRTKSKRVFVDDVQSELEKHNIYQGQKRSSTSLPLFVTRVDRAMGMPLVTMEAIRQTEQAESAENQVVNEHLAVDSIVDVQVIEEQLIPEQNSHYEHGTSLVTDVDIHLETNVPMRTQMETIVPVGTNVDSNPQQVEADAPIICTTNVETSHTVNIHVDADVQMDTPIRTVSVKSESNDALYEGLSIVSDMAVKDVPDNNALFADGSGVAESHVDSVNASSAVISILQESSSGQVDDATSTVITINKADHVDYTADPSGLSKNRGTIKKENPEGDENVSDINVSTDRSETFDTITRNVNIGKPILQVIVPEESSSSKTTALEQSMPKYSTRFMGKKRVFELLTPRGKRKRQNEEVVVRSESPVCDDDPDDDPDCDNQVDEDGPKISVINLEIVQSEDNTEHGLEIPNVEPTKFKPSAVTALPSISEQKLSVNKPDIKLDIVPVIRRRGRPRKDQTQQQQTQVKERVKEKIDGDSKLKCEVCDRTFKNHTGLSIHRQWKHGMSDAVGQKKSESRESFTCEYCNKV